MAHELDFSKGFAAIAVGEGTAMPWHGYVNEYLNENDTPETAVIKAGINFAVKKAKVLYSAELSNGQTAEEAFENKAVIYRDDTGEALSVMSESHYVPAQPIDLVRGLFEVIKGSGFKLDTIMALKGGRVISALARRECEPGQLGEDIQMPYLGLLTSFDGTLARQGNLTVVRRVCMNTVRASLAAHNNHTAKQRNSREFTIESANDLFDKLGEFDAGFAEYMEVARAMANVKVSDQMMTRFFTKLYAPQAFKEEKAWKRSGFDLDAKEVSTNKRNVIADLLNIAHDSPGANLPSANGTLWGAFNAVTFYHDHAARTKGDKRWESASLGNGAAMKESALQLAQELL